MLPGDLLVVGNISFARSAVITCRRAWKPSVCVGGTLTRRSKS